MALFSNTTGPSNTAHGYGALYRSTTGSSNTASGVYALYSNTTGHSNTALGSGAGFYSETGSYNIFLGADVVGGATDTNTIRLGLPYDSGTGVGQNQTFIAGIRGTQLAGDVLQVFIDANGKLGTLNPPQVLKGTGAISASQLQQQLNVQQQQQLQNQQATITELRAELAQLRAIVARGAAGK